jgi:predicted DNA-binding WGR domain protein
LLKLYKRLSNGLSYSEAWTSDGELTHHWGQVGERGQMIDRRLDSEQEPNQAILEALQPAIADGFQPIPMDEHSILLVEYVVEGIGNDQDLAKRHSLEDVLNELLGWTGLGACDGGSSGSGTMEVCCFVVDFSVAQRTIEKALTGTEYSNFNRIYEEGGT